MYKSTGYCFFITYYLRLLSCLCGYFHLQPNCNTNSNAEVLKQDLRLYSHELFAKSAEIGAYARKHLLPWRIPGVEVAFDIVVIVTHPLLVVVVRFHVAVSACRRRLAVVTVIGVVICCLHFICGVPGSSNNGSCGGG